MSITIKTSWFFFAWEVDEGAVILCETICGEALEEGHVIYNFSRFRKSLWQNVERGFKVRFKKKKEISKMYINVMEDMNVNSSTNVKRMFG